MSGWRDDAIEAGARAAFYRRPMELDQSDSAWDELPESWRVEWRDLASAVLDAVEPIIRADERSYSRTSAAAHRDYRARLADLRAQVEALPETRDLDPWDWHEVVEVVLALLDGAQ